MKTPLLVAKLLQSLHRSDKILDKHRYERRAILDSQYLKQSLHQAGSSSIPLVLRSPYLYYEQVLQQLLAGPPSSVLEICAGSGTHTQVLVSSSSNIVASDISPVSLDNLRKRYPQAANLSTAVSDIETLAFPSNSFDLVVSAGGLSYGDNKVVMQEILRVLKPQGFFVCVDSLNHNPIYQVNRLFHVLRRTRTISTIQRMPTLSTIRMYKSCFSQIDCKFFGGFTWLALLLSPLISPCRASMLSDWLDSYFRVSKSAFKFVMVARNF